MENLWKKAPPETIPAIFTGQAEADAAVDLLHKMGVSAGAIHVQAVQPSELQSEGLLAEAVGNAVRINAIRGIVVGSGAGLLFAVGYLWLTHIGGWGVLIPGFVVGAMFGAIGGAYRAVALAEIHWNAAKAQQSRHDLHEGEVLVSVEPGQQYQAVYQLLATHGVQTFLDPEFYGHLPNPA